MLNKMIKKEQKYIEKYCKLCGCERRFVTSLNQPGNIICCICGYTKTIAPFKMVQDQFGCRIKKDNIEENDKPNL